MSYYDEQIEELRKKIEKIKKEQKIFLRIQKVIPDVEVCHKLQSTYFCAKSVNKKWDELYIKDHSSCDDGWNDPVWAIPIRIVMGKWIHGIAKVMIARRYRNHGDNDYDITWNEVNWKDEARTLLGEKSIPIIKKKLQAHIDK